MAANRDEILKDLRNYVIEVHFDKVNGEHRVMRCTLRADLLPPSYNNDINEQKQEQEFHQQNPEVIAAWDVQKGGWRSFRVDNVKYIQNVNESY
jgi:hypothetical protein